MMDRTRAAPRSIVERCDYSTSWPLLRRCVVQKPPTKKQPDILPRLGELVKQTEVPDSRLTPD
jgi:hypothetical protein